MGWLIFIDILLIIVLALMLSVTVNVHLNDETRIKIKYAGITVFSVSPEAGKQRKQKQEKKKGKSKPEPVKKAPASTTGENPAEKKASNSVSSKSIGNKSNDKDNTETVNKPEKKTGKKPKDKESFMSKLGLSGDISETIEFVKQLIKSASKPVKRLISHIKVNKFTLLITVGGEDAAQTAMNYGKINWIVYTAIAVLYEAVKLDVKKIDITADFNSGKTEYELLCKVKLRLGTALCCIIWLLFRLLKMYLKLNSKNENKTATAESNTKPKAEKA